MAAFHEAFADIVALFQHFSMPESLTRQIRQARGSTANIGMKLGQLARQFGDATGMHGALRRFVGEVGSSVPVLSDDMTEPHERGAVIVSAVFAAFLTIYASRCADLIRLATNGSEILPSGEISVDLANRLASEASKTADHVLDCAFGRSTIVRRSTSNSAITCARSSLRTAISSAKTIAVIVAFIDAFRQRGIVPYDIRRLAEDSLLWEPPPMEDDLLGVLSEVPPLLDLTSGPAVERKNAFDHSQRNGAILHNWLTAPSDPKRLLSRQILGFEGARRGMDRHDRRPVLRRRDWPIETHSVRVCRRSAPDGSSKLTLVIELTQTFRAEPDQARYRGGCTLLFDLNDNQLKYLVRKKLFSQWSIKNHATAQLAAMTSAADHGQIYYPPDDPVGRRKNVRHHAPLREAAMTSAPKTPRHAKVAGTPAVSAAQTRSSGAAAEASPPEKSSSGAGSRASVRVYCQGLGDCILVRVKRTSGEDFKLLIDCGVVLGTQNAASTMVGVVENIVKDTMGKIDVLAITHEHWDHLSGFIQATGSFAKLEPNAVWVAWTEDPDDDLAKQLKAELGKAEKALAACATAFHAAGDGASVDMLSDIALAPLGAAATSSTSTKAAFDKVKAMAKVRICRPTDEPFEIPDANARIYVIGPPHDPKLIRKINPSTSSPETYGLAMNGGGALPFGVVSALRSREAMDDPAAPLGEDPARPFHRRMTIPLGAGGRPRLFDDHSVVEGDWRAIDDFFREHYSGGDNSRGDDWRRIDGDWLGPAAELALALQSYTNNTSLVLALELGEIGKGDVLLFAADAQVGNWESWQTWQWPKEAPKVAGPDLLKRTIFYKVGHHGSHNATLKDHGVGEMSSLKAAVIPVDEVEAKKKRWGRMPLPQLISALEKAAPNMVFRTDQKPENALDDVAIGDNYIEVQL